LPRTAISFAFLFAAALGVAGCSDSSLFDKDAYSGMFSKKFEPFKTPEWAKAHPANANVKLNPTGPVAPDDLVAANGACAPAAENAQAAAPAAAPAAPPPPATAPLPDRLEPALPAAGPMPGVGSGVALGMSECEVVRRAGPPSHVSIGTEKGERKVVVSYLGGNWPGIYQFRSGRLKVIEAAPTQAKPERKKRTPPKTARGGARLYVQ
jgi:hypothetical protein